MSKSTDPPLFASISLDEESSSVFKCEQHKLRGKVNVKGELRLSCEECGEEAKCACCGETVRNVSNTFFKCLCSWKAEASVDGKCSLHTKQVGRVLAPNEVIAPYRLSENINLGDIVYIDHETGEVTTSTKNIRRRPQARVGIAKTIYRDSCEVVVVLDGQKNG